MPGPPPLVAVSGRAHPQPQGSPLGRSPTLTASGDPGADQEADSSGQVTGSVQGSSLCFPGQPHTLAPIRRLHTRRAPSHGLGALQQNPTRGPASGAQTSSVVVARPPLLLAPCPSSPDPLPSASSRKDAGHGLQAHPQPRVTSSSPHPSHDCICKDPFPTRSHPQVWGAGYGHILRGVPQRPRNDCALRQLGPPQTVLCCVGGWAWREAPH